MRFSPRLAAPGNSNCAAWMYRSVIEPCECPALSCTYIRLRVPRCRLVGQRGVPEVVPGPEGLRNVSLRQGRAHVLARQSSSVRRLALLFGASTTHGAETHSRRRPSKGRGVPPRVPSVQRLGPVLRVGRRGRHAQGAVCMQSTRRWDSCQARAQRRREPGRRLARRVNRGGRAACVLPGVLTPRVRAQLASV